MTFERDFMEDHMKMCRLEEVGCEFSGVGCDGRFRREDQEEHTRQNSQKHLTLTASLAVETKEQLQQKLLEQDKKHKDVKEQNRMLEMKLKNQEQKHKVEEQKLKQQLEKEVKKLENKDREHEEEWKRLKQIIEEQRKDLRQMLVLQERKLDNKHRNF